MITFHIPHHLDLSAANHNWLWYSHGDAPVDRPVVSGWRDPSSPGIRMARHYFLADHSHFMLSQGYILTAMPTQRWRLDIRDHGEAAMFKLTFL